MSGDPHENGYASLTDFSLLKQEVGTIKSELNEFRLEIRGYFNRSSLRSLWPMIVGVAMALWFVVTQQINSTAKDVGGTADRAARLAEQNTAAIARLTETQQTMVQQNADSRRDRDDQRLALSKLTEVTAALAEKQAEIRARLDSGFTEFETQIDASAQMTNEKFAELFRRAEDAQNSLHDMGAKMPVAPTGPYFFPNISNRNHRTGKAQ